MQTGTERQATAHTNTTPRELPAMPPTTTISLRIPRRRSTALLHVLQTLRVSYITRRQPDMHGMRPDSRRHETVAERVARTAPYLYIRSLSDYL
jgi:hypothetical protein